MPNYGQETKINNYMQPLQKNVSFMRVLGAILLVIILSLVGYWYGQSNKPTVFPKQMAAAGQLIPGFPNDLLLAAKDAKISQSYSIDFGGAAQQYTSEFTLNGNYLLAYLKYKAYLKDNGYYLSNDHVDNLNKSVALYGISKDHEVNISITQASDVKTSNINISYVEKGE